MRVFLSDTHFEDLVELQKVKLMNVWGSGSLVMWSPWGFYLSDLSALQQFMNYSLGLPTIELLSSEALAPLTFLCLYLSFSPIGGTVVCL